MREEKGEEWAEREENKETKERRRRNKTRNYLHISSPSSIDKLVEWVPFSSFLFDAMFYTKKWWCMPKRTGLNDLNLLLLVLFLWFCIGLCCVVLIKVMNGDGSLRLSLNLYVLISKVELQMDLHVLLFPTIMILEVLACFRKWVWLVYCLWKFEMDLTSRLF